MSNQLQITGGGKVRNLEGVITGTSGVLSSVPLGAANGVATLDSGGKVPVSQLPSSVVTYLGTWNAATNTPTLVNGTGDAGDMYICNVAGTVNFGAGPVVFVVGDWVLYGSGTWQKSSGQNGTVTSVGLSTNGGAITIGSSPVTTSGVISFNFNGTNLQYVNGAGNLTTFPTLTGYVPYTGATQDVDLGAFKLNAQSLHVKGTAGNGHLGLKHQSAAATGSANESLIYADTLGDLNWLNGNLYLSKFITSGNTAARSYTFPNANGTVALTSDLANYVDLTTAQTIGGTKTFTDATKNNGGIFLQNASSGSLAGYMNIGGLTNGVKFTSGGGVSNTFTLPSATGYTFTFPNATGTIALTSDIPTNPVGGTGTTNTLPKFTAASTIGNSNITDTGSLITLGSSTLITGSTTASGAIARGTNLTPTLVAAANNDVLVGLDINPTFTNGAFTGVSNVALRINSGFTYLGGTLRVSGTTANPTGAGGFFVFDGSEMSNFAYDYGASAYRSLAYNGSYVRFLTGGTERARFSVTNGNFLLNTTTDAGFRLDVNGTARVQGITTINAAPTTNGVSALQVNATTNNSVAGSMYGIDNNSTVTTINSSSSYIGINSRNAVGATLVQATAVQGAVNISAGTTNVAIGFSVNSAVTGTGAASLSIGYNYENIFTSGSGAVTRQYGIRIGNLTTGTVTNVGLLFNDSGNTTVNGTYDIYSQSGNASYLSGSLGLGASSVNASAKLQVDSTTKGFLPPRMTAAQRTGISSPAEGLIVVQTDGTQGLYLYIGAAWHGITML